MTLDILVMSKEELMDAIVEAEELDNELNNLIMEMKMTRLNLYQKAESIDTKIDQAFDIKRSLTETIADMKKLLTENYGGFVI